jgi:hypothetical protein
MQLRGCIAKEDTKKFFLENIIYTPDPASFNSTNATTGMAGYSRHRE